MKLPDGWAVVPTQSAKTAETAPVAVLHSISGELNGVVAFQDFASSTGQPADILASAAAAAGLSLAQAPAVALASLTEATALTGQGTIAQLGAAPAHVRLIAGRRNSGGLLYIISAWTNDAAAREIEQLLQSLEDGRPVAARPTGPSAGPVTGATSAQSTPGH